jgi:glutamate formiminotransferase/formiminotetrahydrofolate cyclodeaminase
LSKRQIVECAPNFSEGRREDVVGQIAEAIRGQGVQVLDIQADPDQNRSVVRFAGEVDAVERAALAGATMAADLIDMRQHTGEHPRIGATDVIPFVPVAGVSLEDCVAMARRLGERIGHELEVPVYLYGEAATRPERQDVAVLRRGEYEGLQRDIASDAALEPDYGPLALGPAGATAVGARQPMIGLNVWLTGGGAEVAQAVAAAVRTESGGLCGVNAEGAEPETEEGPLVAIAVKRPDRVGLHRVMELVRREAHRYGAAVRSAEIVGLVPQFALLEAAEWYLQLSGFSAEQILENRLAGAAADEAEQTAAPRDFVEAVASDAPTPGGGSVAALAGALAAALNRMVASLTIGREKYADVEDDMKRLRARAAELQRRMLELIDEDADAFGSVMAAYRMPHATAEESEARRDAIQTTLRHATEVPLATMRHAVEVLRLARTAAELGNATAVSDAGVAGYLAQASVQSASLNVDINVRGLRDLEEGDRYRREGQSLRQDADGLATEIDRLVRARIAG